jgi:hypothetical protein
MPKAHFFFPEDSLGIATHSIRYKQYLYYFQAPEPNST